MKKVLSILLTVVLIVTSLSAVFTLSSAATEVSGNLITNGDFSTHTGLTQGAAGQFPYIDNQLPSPAWASPAWATATDFHKWFRVTGGNATIYDNIITDPANANNKIVRAMQTAVQGVDVSAGKTYVLTFDAKADFAFQTFQISFVGLATASTGAEPVLYPVNSAVSGTKTYDNGGTQVVENLSPYLANGTSGSLMKIALDKDKWATYKLTFTLDAARIAEQLCAINFMAGEYVSGDATKGVPFYLDNVSLFESSMISSTIDSSSGKFGGYLATPSSIGAVAGQNVTLKAVAYPGNTFDGWYLNDVKVSSSADYTFVSSGPASYVAKFNATNLISDPGYENSAIATTLKGTEWFVTGTDATWLTMAPSLAVNSTANTPAITPHSGSKMLDIMARNNAINRPITGLTTNTDYQLSFYWYMSEAYNATDKNAIQLVTVADAGTTLATASNIQSTMSWQKVTLNFNSGSHTSVKLNLTYWSEFALTGNQNRFYLDDLNLFPVTNATFTLDCKESAAVVPIGTTQLQAAIGDTFSFKVVSVDTAPVVTVDGTVLTPTSGVYTFTATGNATIKIVCAGDAGLPAVGKDDLGNDLTKYQKDLYLKPIWKDSIVYHEPALFYTGRQTVKLLYPVDSVVSLRSYDLKTYYIKGVDYDIENGLIKILPGSRIPIYTGSLTHVATTDTAAANYGTEQAFKTSATDTLTFMGDTNYPTLAIDVTYKHTTTWAGKGDTGYSPYVPTSQTTQLSRVMQKLENGEPVNILIYGDSISCGWSSSGLNLPSSIYDETNTGSFKSYVINVAPYAPTWMDVVIAELRARYPASTINVTNLALGGKDAGWGAANLAARLKLGKMTPDLMILAFAANDITGGTSTATYGTNMRNIINTLRNPATQYGNPNADVLIWSQNLPNLKALCFTEQKFLDYQTELQTMSNTMTGVGLTRITDTYSQIIKSKEAVDYLNTNVNHGNDFTVRMYEQHILAAMTPLSPVDDQAAADVVIGKISAIGAVTLSSKVAIEDAELAYSGLTTAQQTLVTNYSVLTAARSTYNAMVAAAADQTAANVVIGKITAIGTVTLGSQAAIVDAESAYTGLTAPQKALVTNYSVLVTARSAYDALVAAAADQVAANAVISQINAIGTVTLSSKVAIEQAEAAYTGLSAPQKALVTNHTVLVEARTAYNELIANSVMAGDISGDKIVDLIDVTILSRYVAGWSGLTYQDSALDTSGDGVVDMVDITILSRFIAGYNVEIHGGVAATNASLSLGNATAAAGSSVSVNVNLNDISKLSGNISGYQLTVTYDSNKLTFVGYTPSTAWSSDSYAATAGTAIIVADDNSNSALTLTTNGKIGTLNFTVKTGVSGVAAVSVAVSEATNSNAVPYADGIILGGSGTVAIGYSI